MVIAEIEESDSKTKGIWKVINENRPRKKKAMDSICIKDDSGGVTITNPNEVCNRFNSFLLKLVAITTKVREILLTPAI